VEVSGRRRRGPGT